MELKPGQIIEEFDLDGSKVVFRALKRSDLHGCLRHINSLIREKAFIGWQKPFTLKLEKLWMDTTLKDMGEGKTIMVVVETDGKIIGDAGIFRRKEHAASHVTVTGISLSEKRSMGIGYRLMNALERLAVENFQSEILQLEVFAQNKIARGLYEKCGFKEIGRVRKGMKHYGKYDDNILMVKYL